MDGIENGNEFKNLRKTKGLTQEQGGSSTQYFSGSSIQVGDGYDSIRILQS